MCMPKRPKVPEQVAPTPPAPPPPTPPASPALNERDSEIENRRRRDGARRIGRRALRIDLQAPRAVGHGVQA